jgi:hypothetical protein
MRRVRCNPEQEYTMTKRAFLAVAVWMALVIPAAQSFAGGRTGAKVAKPGSEPGQRAAVLSAMRSRGIVRPSDKVQFVTGIDGSRAVYFFARGVNKRVAKPKAAGEVQRVDVIGQVKRDSKNKSGWSVTMKTTDASAPRQTLKKR